LKELKDSLSANTLWRLRREQFTLELDLLSCPLLPKLQQHRVQQEWVYASDAPTAIEVGWELLGGNKLPSM
jgi:hypothetical protein